MKRKQTSISLKKDLKSTDGAKKPRKRSLSYISNLVITIDFVTTRFEMYDRLLFLGFFAPSVDFKSFFNEMEVCFLFITLVLIVWLVLRVVWSQNITFCH
jgi:hypothetical protein